jgi:hypothetical protein
MRFHPRRWPGVLTGAGFLLLFVTVDVWLALYIARRTPDLISFLLGLLGLFTLPVLVSIGYGLYGLLNLTYDMNRNRLVIRWVGSEQVIPLGRITRIVEGSQLAESVRWRGVRWPGYMIGRGQVPGAEGGRFLSFATEPLSHQLLLVTPSLSYAISPLNRQGFLAALAIRCQMGPVEYVAQEARHPLFLTWSLWRDRTLRWLVLAGAIVNAALFGYLCWRYANLPLILPLHFDPLGYGDRVGARAELFRLPLIGLLMLLADGALSGVLHRRQRVASHLVLGGALLVQALLGVALWSLT